MPPVLARVQFRTAMRAAAVSLLQAYIAAPVADGGAEMPGKLQVYPTIPTSLHPPSAFVERITEQQTFPGPTMRQRFVVARVVVLWRLFAELERGDAVAQLDAFLDGLSDWVLYHYHEPGPTELISSARIDEDPYYTASDGNKAVRTYYAGRIDLEGYTGN
jgi:hypothetical protein